MSKKLISCALCVLVLVTFLALPISASGFSWDFLENFGNVEHEGNPDIRIKLYNELMFPYDLDGRFAVFSYGRVTAIDIDTGEELVLYQDQLFPTVISYSYVYSDDGSRVVYENFEVCQYTDTTWTNELLCIKYDFSSSPAFYIEGHRVYLVIDGYIVGDSEKFICYDELKGMGAHISFPYADNGGYDVGYQKGLEDGYNAADTSTAWANLKGLIFVIFDAPFYVISQSLDFNLFGINIAGTIIAIISVALIAFIAKIVVVKLF